MLHNLLRKQSKKEVVQEFILRFVSVFFFFMTGSILVGIIALVPVYLNTVATLGAYETEQTMKKEGGEDVTSLQERVDTQSARITYIEQDLKKKKVSDLLRTALLERSEGIEVVGYSYNRSTNSLSLEGVATTRDLVVPFARSLEATDDFENVPVPIADLAKNTNLEFRLTMNVTKNEETKAP